MADRSDTHITIGGTVSTQQFETICAHIAEYRLATEWDGYAFQPSHLQNGGTLDLFGRSLPGGCPEELEAFCVANVLPYWRWSGACYGAYDPEIVIYRGDGTAISTYGASDSKHPFVSIAELKAITSLDAVHELVRLADFTPPAFVVVDD